MIADLSEDVNKEEEGQGIEGRNCPKSFYGLLHRPQDLVYYSRGRSGAAFLKFDLYRQIITPRPLRFVVNVW